MLGDAEAVTYVDLTAEQRFTALQSGEVDVLVRNTTYTSSRDGGLAATFLTTTFYDGQGMMVAADSGFTTIDDMTDTTICVLSGTTTELNLTTRMADIPYTPLTFDENPQIQAAFIEGQCDGWTSDKSQLAGVRSAWPEDQGGPEALVILEETFSKEPLGPAVLDGDSQWAQVVDWIVLATMQAEEFGIDSTNVDTFADTEDTNIRNFLGLPVETEEGTAPFDPGLGLADGLCGPSDHPGRQLCRDLRPECGSGLALGSRATAQLALDRRRTALPAAISLENDEVGWPVRPPHRPGGDQAVIM